MRYELGGLNLIVDFAHNPAALSGLVDFAQHLRGRGRLALLLGQAGNREDADIDRLAAVAAAATAGPRRGQGNEPLPARPRRRARSRPSCGGALGDAGVADAAIVDVDGEDAAVRHALAWARAGDVLMLAVHTPDGRTGALSLIDRLRRAGLDRGPTVACLRYRVGESPIHSRMGATVAILAAGKAQGAMYIVIHERRATQPAARIDRSLRVACTPWRDIVARLAHSPCYGASARALSRQGARATRSTRE